MATTPRNVHIDKLLSEVAINYKPKGGIAPMVAPIVSVQHQSDHYPIFSRADMLRTENDKRARGTEASQIHISVSSATYFADNYALKTNVPIEDRANADAVLVQEIYNSGARMVTNKLLLNWEYRLAKQVTSGSNVGSYSGVGSAWTNTASASVLGNIWQAIDNVQDATGMRPNHIILGQNAWRNARRNTPLRDMIKGVSNGQGLPSLQQFGDLFEIENVFVGAAYYNSANEAKAETLTTLWGDNVLVYYNPTVVTREEPAFMYSFRWAAPGLPNMQVERHPYDTKTKSEELEVGYYQDEKIVGPEYGFLLAAVNSST